jgi:hypothetical protein
MSVADKHAKFLGYDAVQTGHLNKTTERCDVCRKCSSVHNSSSSKLS